MAGSKAWRGSCHVSVSTPENSNVSDASLIALMLWSTKRGRTTAAPAALGGASSEDSLEPFREGSISEPALGSVPAISVQHTKGTTRAIVVSHADRIPSFISAAELEFDGPAYPAG